MKKYPIFYISDRTGITSKMIGQSLLSQFSHIEFKSHNLPFIDSLSKAQQALEQITRISTQEQSPSIVIGTITHPDIRHFIKNNVIFYADIYEQYLNNLENIIGQSSSITMGYTHGIREQNSYQKRISAIEYILQHDDGLKTHDLDQADIILIGVSRSGKTPTCLYLALHHGLLVANYPLTSDEFSQNKLPESLLKYREKLFGLSIRPERLHYIRQARRSNSAYASLENCYYEVNAAENLYKQYNIFYLDISEKSIEEIAINITQYLNTDLNYY